MNSLLIKEQKALRNLLFPEVKNYWNQFQDIFKQIQEKTRPDAVHDLRVSIRRLRSIILLLKEISLTINIKPAEMEMKNLMEIFGRLRDMHIQYDLVKKSISGKQTFLNSYLSDLNSQFLKLEQNLQILVRKARITQTGNLVKKILSQKTFHVIPPKGFDKLIQYNVNHIAARGILQKYLMRCFALIPLAKNEHNQVVFHKLRINIKKLRYKLEILHPLVLKAHWKKESVVFRSLQNCMGEVHDIDMAFENIRQYFGKHDPKKLKTREYIVWLQKMQRKRGKLFRKSIARMKNLVNYDFFSK